MPVESANVRAHSSSEGPPRWTWAARLGSGPACFLLVFAWPAEGLPRGAHLLAAILAWAVVYWVVEAIPHAVTALLTSVLAIVLGVAPPATVLAPYADPIIFLFIGSFMLAEAMQGSGLDTRVALAVLRHRWATRSPRRLLGAVGTTACAISLWVSNTATTAMMLPIGTGLLRALGPAGDPARSRFAIGLMLMLTWGSSVAVGIPVGSPPNLIAIAMLRGADRRFTFFEWVAVAMPLTVLMLALTWAILAVRYGRQAGSTADVERHVAALEETLPRWTRAQGNVLGVFLLAVALWMIPGALALCLSPDAAVVSFLDRHLPESVVALLAAVLLFVLPTDLARGEFTLRWRDAARIDWGTILLFGGGLSLGRLMLETGLARAVGDTVLALSGAASVWSLTAVAIVLGLLLSETASNTASASVVVPTMMAVATALGVSPVPPALGAALGASFGFMLPVSTPPNAIVYGSGLVPLREMIRAGILLDVLGALLIWAGLRVLCPLLGLV
jgi:sodium-dependent dicarboxylate transporter 2/3/5